MHMSILTIGYLALFALASAGSVVDEVHDRRPLSAISVLAAHLAGFGIVLAWAQPDMHWLIGPAVPAMLAGGLLWDAWSSLRCARLTAANPTISHEHVDSELVGIAILLGLRLPGYLCGLPLLVQGT
jgi:hypothetical protein